MNTFAFSGVSGNSYPEEKMLFFTQIRNGKKGVIECFNDMKIKKLGQKNIEQKGKKQETRD